MYTVKLDGELMYHPGIKELSLKSAVVTQEINKAGIFCYTIYPNSPFYGAEKKLKSRVEVFDDGITIFNGRVLNTQLGFYKERIVTCEGELSFLLDSIQRPYNFAGTPAQLFTQLIESHNAQVEADKHFNVGVITVTDPNDYIARSDTTYLTTKESIEKKLIEPLGGYLNVRYEADGRYIDYLKDYTELNTQLVEFSKNLLNLDEVIKGENIATAIIPLGAKIESETDEDTDPRVDIKSVNEGIDYVFEQTMVDKYGWIFKPVIHDDITLPINLKNKGIEDLQDWVNLIINLTVSAVDLSALDKQISSYKVGYYTKVISKPHGFDELFLTRKRVIDLLNPANSKLDLGDERRLLTDKVSNSDKVIGDIVERVEDVIRDFELNEELTDIKLSDLKQELISAINQTGESITFEVSENYYQKDETDELFAEFNTKLEQTSTGFEFTFNQFQQELDAIENGTAEGFLNISRYIRFVDGNIELGEVGSAVILKIENDQIAFYDNNVKVAYLSDKKLYVYDGAFINSLQLGNFSFHPLSNGNLSFN